MKTPTRLVPLLSVVALACDSTAQNPKTPESRAAEAPWMDPDSDGASPDGGPVLERLELAHLGEDRAIAYYTFEAPPQVESFVTRFGADTTVNDVGEGYDEKAGDGVFSGEVPFSAARLAMTRARFEARSTQHDELTAMHFRGHAVTAQDAFAPDMRPADSKRWIPTLKRSVPTFTIFPTVVVGPPATLSGLPPTSDPLHSLTVIDPGVVRDPNLTGIWRDVGGQCQQVGNPSGPWGIVGLMDDIGNGYVSAHDLLIGWLASYATSRTVNGDVIPDSGLGLTELTDGPFNGPSIPWPKLVDDGNRWTYNDTFDLSATPVQLTAIVNRTDLAASGYGGDGQDASPSAELRFVFTFIEEETCRPSEGGFILEYEVPLDGCQETEDYFQAWHDLSSLTVGSPAYNTALLAITAPITAAGAGMGRPNESNLRVLRTNEQNLRWPHYLNIFPTLERSSWDVQEFAIDPQTHGFETQTLAQTPAHLYELPDWGLPSYPQPIDDHIQTFTAEILDGTHTVPLIDPSSNDPLRAGHILYGRFGQASITPYVAADFPPWNSWWMHRVASWGSLALGPGFVEARARFSLQTCSGCHYAETFEDGDLPIQFSSVHVGDSTPGGVLEEPFRHIRPDDNLANPAHLSRFLTGTNSTCGPDLFVAPLGGLSQCSQDTCCPIGDPVYGFEEGQVHFNEFHRRGSILEDVVTDGCGALEGHRFADVIVASTH